MRSVIAAAILGVAALVSVTPVQAKGCLKGAAVGGVAGHIAGHGMLGAAAGCLVGRHRANKRDEERVDSDRNARRQPSRTY